MLTHLPYMMEHHPRTTAVVFVVSLILSGMVIWSLEAGREQRGLWWIERDKANLDCRQSGGAFEYFGTQGYHCIPPRAKNEIAP